MSQKRLAENLEGIRLLLSHLHGEVTALEASHAQVLLALQKLEGASDIDELTGVLRRNAFFKKWHELLQRCGKAQENCGVLMIDIDHFKQVNDRYGHFTGDEVLARVSGMLKQFISPRCEVGRLGGEEFAVAVRGTDAEILGIAEFIRRGAERLHGPVKDARGQALGNVEWKCTLSVGMASTRSEGYDSSRLLRTADEALYRAKSKGRNRVQAA